MKHLSLAIAFFFVVLGSAFAQPLKFEQQSLGFSVGIPSMYDYNYSHQMPAVTARYEYGISDKIGIGYIGIGGLLSMAGGEYKQTLGGMQTVYKLSQISIGPRAAYHFDMEDLTANKVWNKLDLYGGAFLGIKQERTTYKNILNEEKHSNRTRLATDLFAGMRYGFTPNIGLFGEIGFGVSYLSIGASFRF